MRKPIHAAQCEGGCGKVYIDLYDRIDTAISVQVKQRNRWKHVLQAKVIKDRDGNVLTDSTSVKNFEELIHEENVKEFKW